MSEGAVRLAELLRSVGRAVVLTGAGVSTPSGIPDFRTPMTGLWANVDPMEVAHIDVFRRDPERFWSFYGDRFATLEAVAPNRAHELLAELEQRGLVTAVITQNIDLLHTRAGSQDVIEVHGTIATSSCRHCGAEVELTEVRALLAAAEDGVPRCPACGRPLKPDVVLFGEHLPVAAMQRASILAASADLLLCIGSSLEVHPVAQLPEITIMNGGRIALVTKGPTPYDRQAAVKLEGDVVDELEAVVDALDRFEGL